MTNEQLADAVVTRLYRRFKEWNRRRFGPEDVTWCEVKADVLELIRLERAAAEPKAPRDAEHCDFPDCEQHWTTVVDMALAAMAKFHESFKPEDNPELTPCTTPAAFCAFVDEHARLMRIRASGNALNRRAEPLICWCHKCNPDQGFNACMILCPDCGNKRCPKASDHSLACTNSNEPGQPGSVYA